LPLVFLYSTKAFTHLQLLITALDVLHSWTIPYFGVKIDACPVRLNQAILFY